MVIANRRQLRFPGQDAGQWNKRKFKALYILDLRQKKGQPGIALGALADLTGITRESLSVALSSWQKWGYVSRRGERMHYTYVLASKGVKFLRWAEIFISFSDREKWLNEIIEAQKVLRR